MRENELRVDKYLKPTIESVSTQNVNLEELVVACFHCDPSSNSGTNF